MPRAGDRRFHGGFYTDLRREGLGPDIPVPVVSITIAVSAVDTVYDVINASTVIGDASHDGIATGAVNTIHTLLEANH